MREIVGHSRKEAQRALDALKGDVDRRRYRVLEEIAFDVWADCWLAGFTGKENSRRVYATTLGYTREVFGKSKVRDIGPRPKVAKSKPAYYTDEELARLWPELAYRPLYLYLCKAAVLTGLRSGGLAALKWDDLDLLNRELHVSRTYTSGIGVTATKSNEARTVDLTRQAVALFESWLAESGDKGLVFEREDGGFLEPRYTTRHVLYPGLERAGIPRVGKPGASVTSARSGTRSRGSRSSMRRRSPGCRSSSATAASRSPSTPTGRGRARPRSCRRRISRRRSLSRKTALELR